MEEDLDSSGCVEDQTNLHHALRLFLRVLDSENNS